METEIHDLNETIGAGIQGEAGEHCGIGVDAGCLDNVVPQPFQALLVTRQYPADPLAGDLVIRGLRHQQGHTDKRCNEKHRTQKNDCTLFPGSFPQVPACR
jgi:hypothetical protein